MIRGGIEHDHDYHPVVAVRSISASKVKVPWSWETVPTVCRHINRSPLLPAPNPPPHIPLVALYIMHGSAPALLLLSNESESLQGWKGERSNVAEFEPSVVTHTHHTPFLPFLPHNSRFQKNQLDESSLITFYIYSLAIYVSMIAARKWLYLSISLNKRTLIHESREIFWFVIP